MAAASASKPVARRFMASSWACRTASSGRDQTGVGTYMRVVQDNAESGRVHAAERSTRTGRTMAFRPANWRRRCIWYAVSLCRMRCTQVSSSNTSLPRKNTEYGNSCAMRVHSSTPSATTSVPTTQREPAAFGELLVRGERENGGAQNQPGDVDCDLPAPVVLLLASLQPEPAHRKLGEREGEKHVDRVHHHETVHRAAGVPQREQRRSTHEQHAVLRGQAVGE